MSCSAWHVLYADLGGLPFRQQPQTEGRQLFRKMEKIRFVLVGTGRISDWVLRGALEDRRFEAVGVCSRSEERAREFIDMHPSAFGPDAKIFTSIEDAAACPDVDAVYIGTPNSTHRDYAVAALRAGKHVLCEKPLGLNEAEVREMALVARENRCLLMEAMISTLLPVFREARRHIPKLGRLRHYSSSFCQYSSRYGDLLKGKVASSFNPELGGGALRDVGIYVTYPLVSLFGYPDSVSSSMIRMTTPMGDVDIHGSALLSYGDMTANLVFSKCTDAFAPTEICGEEGNMLIDRIHISREACFLPHHAPTSGRGGYSAAQLIAEGLDHDEYYYEFKEFIDVLKEGRTESAINSLDVSLLNARLMDAIAKSARNV